VVKTYFNCVHCDVGVDFPTTRADAVEIALAQELTTTAQALPLNPALPPPPFHVSCHLDYLTSYIFIGFNFNL